MNPDDLVERMRAARLAVQACEARVHTAKGELRQADAAFRKLESEWLNPRPMPLFEGPREEVTAPPGQPVSTVGHGLGLRGVSETQANATAPAEPINPGTLHDPPPPPRKAAAKAAAKREAKPGATTTRGQKALRRALKAEGRAEQAKMEAAS